jgi:hypothetical protein
MRVLESRRENLTTGGKSLRVWSDTHAKLKKLAGLSGLQMATLVDALVHDALQLELDRLSGEAPPDDGHGASSS